MAGEQDQQLNAAQNRLKAFRLKLAGHSYRQIARRLKCSVTAAYRYVSEELAELAAETKEKAEQLRAIEIAKLDDIEVKMRHRLKGCDDADAAKVAAIIIRASESRRKLCGLDSPDKVEVTGNLYTVKEASPACAAWDEPRKEAE